MQLIDEALKRGLRQLSEYESKLLLKEFEIPVVKERLVNSIEEAKLFAESIGYPVVLKINSPWIGHKTEKGLVITNIVDEEDLVLKWQVLLERHTPKDQEGILIQEMVEGKRELAMGLTRDPQFGPCVMFGLGGIFLEILNDVTFRVAPLEERDAGEMLEEIRAKKILSNIRGMPEADRATLSKMLITIGEIGLRFDKIKEIDLNPVILKGSQPVVVDALVVLD